MRKFLLITFYDSWQKGQLVKKINQKYDCNESEIIALAKDYYNNSEVMDEIDLDVLQNAIDFIKRVDEVFEY